jgi:hypothetical protein
MVITAAQAVRIFFTAVSPRRTASPPAPRPAGRLHPIKWRFTPTATG